MNCSGLLVPDWSIYLKDSIPLIPGIQPLLLLSGKREIEVPDLPSLTWTCHGIYEVKVNGGGLLTKDLGEPPLNYYNVPLPLVKPWKALKSLGLWLEDEMVKGIVNPLSWDPLTPIIIDGGEGPPTCVTLGGESYYYGRLDPHRTIPVAPCTRHFKREYGELRLGQFYLENTRKFYRKQNLAIVDMNDCRGILTSHSATFKGDCCIRLKTPYWEYEFLALYPSCFREYRILGELETGPLPAVVIGLTSKIAVASRSGLIIRLIPGSIEVCFKNTLRMVLAGAAGAYRVFLEDLIDWKIVEAPRNGYGNGRSSWGSLVLVGGGEGYIEYAVSNPLSQTGIAEVRLPYIGKIADIHGPYGREVLPVSKDLLRIPVPPGFHGCARVELSRKKLFMRIIKRKIRGS